MTRNSVQFGVIVTWLRQAVTVVCGLVMMPFVARVIGEERYGTWLFLNAFTGWYALMCLGFGATISRYTSKYFTEKNWKKLNETASLIFAIYVAMGLIVLVISAIASWFAPMMWDWSPVANWEVSTAILIMGVTIFFAITGGVFGGILMGVQRYDLERTVVIVAHITRFVLTLMFLTRNLSLVQLAAFNLSLTMIEATGHCVLAFRYCPGLSIGIRHLTRETFRECTSFSVWAMLDDIAYRLIYLTDAIVIGVALGPKAIIPFAVAGRIANEIKVPILQIGQIFLPKAGELQTDDKHAELQQLTHRGTAFAFLMIAGLFVGVAFFGDVLVHTWWKQTDGELNLAVLARECHLLVMILLAAQIIAIPIAVVRSTLMGMGHAKRPAQIYFVEALFNISLSAVLVQYYGLVGVALGTLIPVVLFELTLLLPYACSKLNIQLRPLLADVFWESAIPLIALTAFCYAVRITFGMQPGWTYLIGVAAGGGMLLLVCWKAVLRTRGTTANGLLQLNTSATSIETDNSDDDGKDNDDDCEGVLVAAVDSETESN